MSNTKLLIEEYCNITQRPISTITVEEFLLFADRTPQPKPKPTEKPAENYVEKSKEKPEEKPRQGVDQSYDILSLMKGIKG